VGKRRSLGEEPLALCALATLLEKISREEPFGKDIFNFREGIINDQ
jgi:hypothetical protein